MMPGPTIIRACAACGKRIAQHTTLTGNTFGARFWTDGKMDAPQLPDRPSLVKCRHCGNLIWIDDQKQAGIFGYGLIARYAEPLADERPGPGTTPTLLDYLGVLDEGIGDKDKERYVRIRAWWAGNDRRRELSQPTPLDCMEAQNLRNFADLLDETEDNDRLIKAEALRELGEFGEAEHLLASPFEDRRSHAASIIRGLNQKRIAAVAEMKCEMAPPL